MTYLKDRITIDEGLCNGKPTIRGLRITVQTIMEFLTAGDTKEEISKHRLYRLLHLLWLNTPTNGPEEYFVQ